MEAIVQRVNLDPVPQLDQLDDRLGEQVSSVTPQFVPDGLLWK